MRRSFVVIPVLFACVGWAALFACSPSAKEAAPPTFGEIPTEPPPSSLTDNGFTVDRSQEGVVVAGGLRQGDGGLAWCTSPSTEQVLVSMDLSPNTSVHVYSGGCIPSDGYYRACNDAGMPVFAPTCDAKNSGKRFEVVTGGRPAVAIRADTVELVTGALPDGTWALGPGAQRAILVNTDSGVGTGVKPTIRVAAVAYKTDDWHEPSDDFAEVVPNPKAGTFTFWRKALCVDTVGCVIARWEASRTGIKLSTAEKGVYKEAKTRIKGDVPNLRSAAPSCPTEVLAAAARVFTLGRLAGDSEPAALKEFDGLVAGLSTNACPAGANGRPKSLQAIRGEMASAVRKLIATRAPVTR